MSNKLKIINDPVYGFIDIPYSIVFDVIEHPWFQRLRYIRQLGMTHLVYPGAIHTRFHHALGAMHLMGLAIDELRNKGNEITEEEAIGATLAILLHDIGHGPYSHALENSLAENLQHEVLGLIIMKKLNEEFKGKLDIAIQIFQNTYHKKFLHQLVSSQLDVDRLDYLMRDSFFTGVSEGVISCDRIIKMLQVKDDILVVQEKGIYSIEKFIVARRLMYWQVYLHKTVISAEHILINILRRAKELTVNGEKLFASPPLSWFLENSPNQTDFEAYRISLEMFIRLDDNDIYSAIKSWQFVNDKALSQLCKQLVNRKLLKVEITKEEIKPKKLFEMQKEFSMKSGIKLEQANLFVFSGKIANNAYNLKSDKIFILKRNGELKDIAIAADRFNISALSEPVVKYFLCWPE